MIKLFIGGSTDLYHFSAVKSYLEISEGAEIEFQGDTNIAAHCSILARNSKIFFGENFSCNNGCRIASVVGIVFGNDVLLGGNIVIRDSDGHPVYDIDDDGNIIHEHSGKESINIGNHCWIASECHVLKGVKIPEGCIVAYGSVCVKSTEDSQAIVAGHPAKTIKKKITWDY